MDPITCRCLFRRSGPLKLPHFALLPSSHPIGGSTREASMGQVLIIFLILNAQLPGFPRRSFCCIAPLLGPFTGMVFLIVLVSSVLGGSAGSHSLNRGWFLTWFRGYAASSIHFDFSLAAFWAFIPFGPPSPQFLFWVRSCLLVYVAGVTSL